VGTIEIRIHSLAELFDPLDPSPFHQRALDRGAESYILACAGDHPAREPLRLLVHHPESLHAHGVEMADGIHGHFRRAHARGERQFRRRMRIGAISLGAGLIILAASARLRNLLGDVEGRGLAVGLAEGLLILGWVAMWRPIEILLYEHWESHLDHAVLDRLASIPVEFLILPDTGGPGIHGSAG
jgi:hypothetical protein